MSESAVSWSSDFHVDLVNFMGDDTSICQAARVSTVGADSLYTSESVGLINFLLKNRHGTPFEHATMTFRITAPIFVWREFMRHRIGFSYNEESGRYKVLDGVFYMPSNDRPLVQIGKPGEYKFVPGTVGQHNTVCTAIRTTSLVAWDNYRYMLEQGIAKEVARMVLPVNIYSTAYVTCNPRSLMSFLALRTQAREHSMFPSYPQWEISRVADMLEQHFETLFPTTHKSFDENGRVSP